MVQYIITPWRTHAELLSVRDIFYPNPPPPSPPSSSNPPSSSSTIDVGKVGKVGNERGKIEVGVKERKETVARVAVWVQRGNCPHLVESTAILNSAILNDVVGNEAYCVRAAYAAAFSRFVTGLLDSNQTKLHKQSMYSLAKTISLPATFVELRHQATHETLPSLSKLRLYTSKALVWIWEYYWVKLKEEESDEEKVRELVKGYIGGNGGMEKVVRELEGRVKRDGDAEGVMEILLRVMGGLRDVGMLRRGVELQRRLFGEHVEGIEGGGNIESVRLEMLRMQREFEDVGEEEVDERPKKKRRAVEEGGGREKGWAMYEGDWVPKPIGVV